MDNTEISMAKQMNSRNTRSRKQKNQGKNTLLLVIIALVVVLGTLGYVFLGGGSSDMPSNNRAPRDPNVYDTMMQNNAYWKRSELLESGKSDSQTQRQITWLTNIQDMVSMIPWESTYLASIDNKDVESNQNLASFRIDLIHKFEFIRNKLDDAIGDPSDDKIADAMSTLRSNRQLIRDAMNDAKAKSSQIGAENSDTIYRILNALLEMMGSKDYD